VKRIHVRGRLLDDRGNPIVGATVRIVEETGKFPEVAVTTLENGRFEAWIDPPAPGDYSVCLVFPGGPELHASTFVFPRRVTVPAPEAVTPGGVSPEVSGIPQPKAERRVTTLSITSCEQTSPYSLEVTCSALLLADGQPLGGKEVSFLLNGREVAKAVTSGEGLACTKFGVPSAGTYKVQATFRGDNDYAGSTSDPVDVQVKVQPRSRMTLMCSPGPGVAWVTGWLESDTKPLPGRVVTVTCQETGDSASVETSPTGEFRAQLKIVSGTNTIRAEFGGDKDFSPASAECTVRAYTVSICADVPSTVVKISGQVKSLTATYKGKDYDLLRGESPSVWPGEEYSVSAAVWAPPTRMPAAWEVDLVDGTELLAMGRWSGGDYTLRFRESASKARRLRVVLKVPGQPDP
jgi:hypothetical protein